MSSQKQAKRSSRGVGAAKKKISMNDDNKENIDPIMTSQEHNRRLILEQRYTLDVSA